MARRSKEEAEQTRELLLDAAEEVFLEVGVSDASLETIAKRAGVTRGALYWHFKNKMDLFDAMHARVKLPMDALYDAALTMDDPMSGLKDLCLTCLTRLTSDERARRVSTILIFHSGQAAAANETTAHLHQTGQEFTEKFRKVFAIAQKQGQLKKEVTPEVAAHSLHAYLYGLHANYLRAPGLLPLDAIAGNLMDVFFESIRAK